MYKRYTPNAHDVDRHRQVARSATAYQRKITESTLPNLSDTELFDVYNATGEYYGYLATAAGREIARRRNAWTLGGPGF